MCQMKFFPTLYLVAAASLAIGNLPAFSDELPAPPVVPGATKVLIVPTLDETGDKPEMQRAHVATGNHRAEYELLIRGFQLISPDEAIRAARKDDLDLDDAESRGKKTLRTLGQDTGADWVVALAVDSVREEKVTNLFSAIGYQRRAKAKIQLRILDVKANQYLCNRFSEESKTTQHLIGNIGTTGLFKQAIDTALERSFENVLAPYPIVKKIDDEFGEADLVTGADLTKPTDASTVAAPAASDSKGGAASSPAADDSKGATAPPAADSAKGGNQ